MILRAIGKFFWALVTLLHRLCQIAYKLYKLANYIRHGKLTLQAALNLSTRVTTLLSYPGVEPLQLSTDALIALAEAENPGELFTKLADVATDVSASDLQIITQVVSQLINDNQLNEGVEGAYANLTNLNILFASLEPNHQFNLSPEQLTMLCNTRVNVLVRERMVSPDGFFQLINQLPKEVKDYLQHSVSGQALRATNTTTPARLEFITKYYQAFKSICPTYYLGGCSCEEALLATDFDEAVVTGYLSNSAVTQSLKQTHLTPIQVLELTQQHVDFISATYLPHAGGMDDNAIRCLKTLFKNPKALQVLAANKFYMPFSENAALGFGAAVNQLTDEELFIATTAKDHVFYRLLWSCVPKQIDPATALRWQAMPETLQSAQTLFPDGIRQWDSVLSLLRNGIISLDQLLSLHSKEQLDALHSDYFSNLLEQNHKRESVAANNTLLAMLQQASSATLEVLLHKNTIRYYRKQFIFTGGPLNPVYIFTGSLDEANRVVQLILNLTKEKAENFLADPSDERCVKLFRDELDLRQTQLSSAAAASSSLGQAAAVMRSSNERRSGQLAAAQASSGFFAEPKAARTRGSSVGSHDAVSPCLDSGGS